MRYGTGASLHQWRAFAAGRPCELASSRQGYRRAMLSFDPATAAMAARLACIDRA